MKTIIRNISIVNEGQITIGDVLISNERIEKIGKNINLNANYVYHEINGEGKHLLPGVIDDQVHFREPGLTHKGNIYSESKAAVAGGITSFMDMPNTHPNTLTQELLEQKYQLAATNSLANFSFFMGICKNNLEEALKTNNENVCGITDDGLYFHNDEGILANYPDFLDELFSKTDSLVALHSEDDNIIKLNTAIFRAQFGENIPFEYHPKIRSEEACYLATKRVIEISKKHNNRLHFFHITTAKEANLFEANVPVQQKRITAEACIPHLCFSDIDYLVKGSKIKWNPAVKTQEDKDGLFQALLNNQLDIVATDHAPHTIEEKSGNYFKANSGGPLVQHSLPAMLEFYHENKISLEKIVEKMSHNVAEIYKIKERGYIREGYYADLVLVDLNNSWTVNGKNILYKCGWSPFEGKEFKSRVLQTLVNGNIVYNEAIFNEEVKGKRLIFSKIR
jgi:dihydroorotase